MFVPLVKLANLSCWEPIGMNIKKRTEYALRLFPKTYFFMCIEPFALSYRGSLTKSTVDE